MKTTTKPQGNNNILLAAGLLLATLNVAHAQVQGPNHGLSTVVIANHAQTWQNTSNILLADQRFTSVALSIGQVSDTLEVANFRMNVPEDAVITGITVTINKGAAGSGISDNSVKLIRNGQVCGQEHANTEQWSANAQTVLYGADDDKWGMDLTPADVNSYAFGVVLCVSNSIYGIENNTANIDYINVSVSYKKPDQLGMVDYTAYFEVNEVRLDWAMAAQTEFTNFAVERSNDGIKTEVIGNVKGIVNSENAEGYNFTDNSPLFGTSYYRLSGKGADGTTQNFNWVTVSTNEKISNVSLYPNPSGDKVTVKFPSTGQPAMLMDDSGRVLINQTVPTFSNTENTTYVQDVSRLSSGAYMVLVNSGDKNYTDRFIKR